MKNREEPKKNRMRTRERGLQRKEINSTENSEIGVTFLSQQWQLTKRGGKDRIRARVMEWESVIIDT